MSLGFPLTRLKYRTASFVAFGETRALGLFLVGTFAPWQTVLEVGAEDLGFVVGLLFAWPRSLAAHHLWVWSRVQVYPGSGPQHL